MIQRSYISCSCNRSPHVLDWGRNDLVCFASNKAVSVYDPKKRLFGTILSTLHLHSKRVNIVRWIKPRNNQFTETKLISASSDGTAIIWKANDIKSGEFKAQHVIQVNGPITICDAVYISNDFSKLLVCTGSTYGEFKIWKKLQNQKVKLIQNIHFSKKFPIHARFALCPSKSNCIMKVLLFIALDDSSVQLYISSHDLSSNETKLENFVHIQILVGHEDWVTSIECILDDAQNLLVATASQDNTIRLWKILQTSNRKIESFGNKILKLQTRFFVCSDEYQIILESILIGHNSWVYGVQWHPPITRNNKVFQPLILLSCSLDKTTIIWKPTNNGVWTEVVRVGDVGGNSLGFYGCKFSPNGMSILAHSYQGSLHMWQYHEESQKWKQKPVLSGHYNSVMDLSWDSKGRFLMTTGTDQTTRIHAPWFINKTEESWHEISRPQIHGHDISCLAILGSYTFASGAEEKVVRIFTSPSYFKNYLKSILYSLSNFDSTVMAEVASTSSLGLTNKTIFDERWCKKYDAQNSFSLGSYKPLLEEHLVQQTLWPEIHKLYGHGYEIYSIAARQDGKLLATASKATSSEYASIILWDTNTWCPVQKLLFHQLTVTQIAFSPNDEFLLSVSRDRCWSLYIYKNKKYELFLSSSLEKNFHTRIIWSCAWTRDSKYFATGSRDGKVGIWSKDNTANKRPLTVTDFLFHKSITALSFAPYNDLNENCYILAVGFENGCIDIREIKKACQFSSYEWTQISFLNTSQAHHLAVKKLSFRPMTENQKNIVQLASCGLDGAVKIHDILIT